MLIGEAMVMTCILQQSLEHLKGCSRDWMGLRRMGRMDGTDEALNASLLNVF